MTREGGTWDQAESQRGCRHLPDSAEESTAQPKSGDGVQTGRSTHPTRTALVFDCPARARLSSVSSPSPGSMVDHKDHQDRPQPQVL